MKKTNWKISLSIIFLVFLGVVFMSPITNAQNLPIVSITGPIDALTTLYHDVAALKGTAFAKSDYQKELLHEINATIDEVEDGEYCEAIKKLYHIEDKIDRWIIATDQPSLIGVVKVAITAISNASETTVPTRYGQVAGADAGNDSWVWAGVPYAQPPIGALRWKAPQDPHPWHGVRHSTINFSPAVQPLLSAVWTPEPPGVGTLIGSEDCLYLNIFRPKDADTNLPVFVWIHGGSNYFGGANVYNAAYLASQANMIVVVIQYRLGPFGFLYFPALNPHGTAEDKSGNYGTLDTIKAVKWVRDNIRSFGGNPHNIAVGGQSAGGFNTLNLLTSPLSNGLFQRAFIMSAGGGDVPTSTTLAYTITDKLLGQPGAHTGMTDAQIAAYLRSKSAYDIEQALMVNGSIPLGTIAPVIDGTVITDTFTNNISAGNYSKIPILLGNTKYEEKPFLPLFVPQWSGVFTSFLPAPSQTTFNQIFATLPSYIYEACGYYPSLDWKAVMVDQLATSMKNYQDDVYCYRLMWGGVSDPGDGSDLQKDLAFLYGTGHGSDIPFIIGWDTDVNGLGLFNSTNQGGRVALQQAMMSYLAQFAATGNPNGSATTVTWDPWSNVPGESKYISFDATNTDASISMQTDSYTDAGVVGTVNALPQPPFNPISIGLIESFFFFSPLIYP
jgi:para-nitrobenzyl esterase